jgi:hypothetical protein
VDPARGRRRATFFGLPPWRRQVPEIDGPLAGSAAGVATTSGTIVGRRRLRLVALPEQQQRQRRPARREAEVWRSLRGGTARGVATTRAAIEADRIGDNAAARGAALAAALIDAIAIAGGAFADGTSHAAARQIEGVCELRRAARIEPRRRSQLEREDEELLLLA